VHPFLIFSQEVDVVAEAVVVAEVVVEALSEAEVLLEAGVPVVEVV
jgi:hypothetical protein